MIDIDIDEERRALLADAEGRGLTRETSLALLDRVARYDSDISTANIEAARLEARVAELEAENAKLRDRNEELEATVTDHRMRLDIVRYLNEPTASVRTAPEGVGQDELAAQIKNDADRMKDPRRARLDPHGAAKPKTEILAVHKADGKCIVAGIGNESYVVRPCPSEARSGDRVGCFGCTARFIETGKRDGCEAHRTNEPWGADIVAARDAVGLPTPPDRRPNEPRPLEPNFAPGTFELEPRPDEARAEVDWLARTREARDNAGWAAWDRATETLDAAAGDMPQPWRNATIALLAEHHPSVVIADVLTTLRCVEHSIRDDAPNHKNMMQRAMTTLEKLPHVPERCTETPRGQQVWLIRHKTSGVFMHWADTLRPRRCAPDQEIVCATVTGSTE